MNVTQEYTESPITSLRIHRTTQAITAVPVNDTRTTVIEKLAAADLGQGARTGRNRLAGIGASGATPSLGQRK